MEDVLNSLFVGWCLIIFLSSLYSYFACSFFWLFISVVLTFEFELFEKAMWDEETVLIVGVSSLIGSYLNLLRFL